MSLASSPYSRSTARGQKANRGHPRSTIVEKKRDTCRPRGRDDTRSNRFGRAATHKCVYTWTGDTSSRQATSLPSPPFGEGPESRFGSRVTEPFIVNTVNRWHHVHVNDPQKRNRIKGIPPPQGGVGTKRQFWRDTAPEWQFEGKITGDSRLFAIVNAISGISILERRRLFHLFGGEEGGEDESEKG